MQPAFLPTSNCKAIQLDLTVVAVDLSSVCFADWILHYTQFSNSVIHSIHWLCKILQLSDHERLAGGKTHLNCHVINRRRTMSDRQANLASDAGSRSDVKEGWHGQTDSHSYWSSESCSSRAVAALKTAISEVGDRHWIRILTDKDAKFLRVHHLLRLT
jgi:hypothetical protein